MLDERTENILGTLRRLCPVGGYAVVSAEELAEGGSADGVSESLVRLSAGGYISLRFSEGDEYCLAVLQKGREYEAAQPAKKGFFVRNRGFLIYAAITFSAAFLGGLIAGLLT